MTGSTTVRAESCGVGACARRRTGLWGDKGWSGRSSRSWGGGYRSGGVMRRETARTGMQDTISLDIIIDVGCTVKEKMNAG